MTSQTREVPQQGPEPLIGPSALPPDDAADRACIDTIRTLAMDAVQRASSGHPGTPMALAPAACVLWSRFLRHNPLDPCWPAS
jgi:transketolase